MANMTPVGTLSYPFLFKPQKPKKPTDTAYYNCAILFDEEAMKTDAFKEMQQAALDLLIENIGREKLPALIKDKKVKTGFRDDIESSGYSDDYKCYIRLKTKERPVVFDRFADPVKKHPVTGAPVPMVMTDANNIYAGCRVKAKYGLYFYDNDGNRGVGFGLRQIQKIADGTRIDGRGNPEDGFEALEEALDMSSYSTGGGSSGLDELKGLFG